MTTWAVRRRLLVNPVRGGRGLPARRGAIWPDALGARRRLAVSRLAVSRLAVSRLAVSRLAVSRLAVRGLAVRGLAVRGLAVRLLAAHRSDRRQESPRLGSRGPCLLSTLLSPS